jgi:SprT protein
MSETEQAVQEVIKAFEMARAKLGIVMPLPRVTFHLRGTTAGKAYIRENRIDLNPVLMHENLTKFIDQTVYHECGHILAYKQCGFSIKPHGPEWARILWMFGKPAKRCHNYSTETVTGRKPKGICNEIV